VALAELTDTLRLSNQERRILVALLHGPLTTGECWDQLAIPTLSQRAGELERKGLVVRRHVEVETGTGRVARVVEASLTATGRAEAERLLGLAQCGGTYPVTRLETSPGHKSGIEPGAGEVPAKAPADSPEQSGCRYGQAGQDAGRQSRLFDDAPLRPR